MSFKSFLTICAAVIFLAACNKNNDDNPSGFWAESVFIINEGPFPTGSGTVSAFNRETLEVSDKLFETANGWPLGNIVQSLTVHNDKAFIVVNNTNTIEVVNLEDFKSIATIDNLTLPRYFTGIDGSKGFVSCWDSTVKVIDLQDFSVKKSIPAGTGPDEMIVTGNELFVINSGGFGVDSTVTVININSEEIVEEIFVGHRPAGICLDGNGKIWVLCSGRGWNGFPSADDTPARLICIDPSTHGIIDEIIFPDSENHPDNLIINGDGSTLFYNHPDGIFSFHVSSSGLNTQPLIIEILFAGNSMFYALGFDSKENVIYATDPLDFAQNGWVYRYDALDGSLVDSFLAGRIPGGFWFNN